VQLVPKAVWINNAGVEFSSDGADGGSVLSDGTAKRKVDSIRLKDILGEESGVDFLKMDIEGAEVDVLVDCGDSLKNVKNIFVEYHSWQHLPQRLDLLLSTLQSAGFRYYIRSIGPIHTNPFIESNFENGMDIQLNIHAKKN